MIDKEDYVFTLKKRILGIRSKGHNGDLTTNISINSFGAELPSGPLDNTVKSIFNREI